MILGDKEIRYALIDFLKRRFPKPTAILHELRVHNGNAIADIVAVYGTAHCFEIKGERDTLNRIARQAEFYNKSFTKVTLVTTQKHLSKAQDLIPKRWGILVAKHDGGRISFAYIRGARHNVDVSKLNALSILWKSELMKVSGLGTHLRKKLTRLQLSELISKNKTKEGVATDIAGCIIKRSRTGKKLKPIKNKG